MSEKTVVVALGHRALGTTLPEQKQATKVAAKAIADLVEEGTNVVISHSNGPQVGMIHTAMNEFGKTHPDYTFSPMSVCSAMSQGYIGYDLQNAIRAELLSRGIYKPVATILTQVVIDPYDEAFGEPEKVIGRVLNSEEAESEEDKGNFVTEVADGEFRRILAAPKPQKIIELETIRTLADAGQVVIAAGGGGIPVMEQGIDLHGASAIIEKDFASELLAEELNADTLLILTSVEKVSLNKDTDRETYLDTVSAEDARKYIDENQFALIVNDYLQSDRLLSEEIDKVLDFMESNSVVEHHPSGVTSPIRIAKGKKTSVLMIFNSMYKAGWLTDVNGNTLKNRDEALNQILRNGFGVEKETAISQTLNPSNCTTSYSDRFESLMRKLFDGQDMDPKVRDLIQELLDTEK